MATAATLEERQLSVQRSIGKVLWEIQALEETLARLIAVVFKTPAKASLVEARAVLDGVRSGTMGRLVNETRRLLSFDQFATIFVTRLVEQRNWLVHRSWRTHRHYLTEEETYTDLRYRISRLSSDAIEFNALFLGVISDWASEHGHSLEKIDDLAEEMHHAQNETEPLLQADPPTSVRIG